MAPAIGLLAPIEQQNELLVSEPVEFTGLGQRSDSRLLSAISAASRGAGSSLVLHGRPGGTTHAPGLGKTLIAALSIDAVDAYVPYDSLGAYTHTPTLRIQPHGLGQHAEGR